MKRQSLWSAIGIVLVLALLALLVGLRMQVVDRVIGSDIACDGCFNSPVIIADLVLFSLAAGVLLLAGYLRPEWLGRLVQGGIALLVLIYAADLIVLRLFNSRLFLSDAALFIPEHAAVWDQFYTGLGGRTRVVLLLLGLVAPFVLLPLMPPVRNGLQRGLLGMVLVVTAAAAAWLEPESYVNEWAVANVFSANLASSERTPYSAGYAEEVLSWRAAPRQVRAATPLEGQRPNVILVLLESWSAWHSRLFGGFENWTPQLDAAAERGVRFDNFHGIGFSTDKGLAGLLAGQQIWSSFLHWFQTPPFHSMWDVPRSLPSVFNDDGYRTAFLTTGPLGLYEKGEWLKNLGFGYVEGNEHPFYADLPRFAFESASDQALYDRAREWQVSNRQPYLLVLETVTTHQPYIDPDSRTQSLELVMKFADRAFGNFLRDLDASGFFENGVLMVASDHRSMTPIPEKELRLFGRDAHSRIPAFLIGAEIPQQFVDNRVYSQSDVAPSFDYWLSGHTQLDPLQAIMFGPQPAPDSKVDMLNCAFHSRGDQRGLVEVICSQGRGQIRLDGDSTRFVTVERLDDQAQEQILQDLAVLRLDGLRRQELREARLAGAARHGVEK